MSDKISQIHFRNACRLEPSVFTCAVDSFLEICFVALHSLIENMDFKSDFFTCIHDCLSQYDILLNSAIDDINLDYEIILSTMRQPVWDYLVQNCPSFANRNCDAQFSEIFSSCIFNTLSEQEKVLFMTSYKLRGYCDCNEDVSVESRIMLNYISELDLNKLDSFNNWQSLLDPLVRNKSLQCICGKSCDSSLELFSGPKVCLLEFYKDTNEQLLFDEEIIIQNYGYVLKGLVRHQGRHFTCAVVNSKMNWTYIDDLQDNIIIYKDLKELYDNQETGWFFCVYVLDNLQNNDEDIHFKVTENIDINKKRKHEFDNKDYPLRSKYKYKKELSCDNDIEIKNLNKDVEDLKTRKKNYFKVYYERNREQKQNYSKEYYERNKDKCKTKAKHYAKDHYEKNKERKKQYDKEYYEKNKERLKSKKQQSKKEKSYNGKQFVDKKFHKSLEMTLLQCLTCKEAWPLSNSSKHLKVSEYECFRCKKEKMSPKKFSAENDMIPSKVPPELQGLTQIEEMLIARAFPVIQVYTKPNGGQKAYKGHVLTLPHDLQHIANVLPRYPSDIPVIVFKFDGKDNNSKELKVRRQKVIDALVWLTGKNDKGEYNNVKYQDVVIDRSRFESLPENGYLNLPMNVDFKNESNNDNIDEETLPDMGPNPEGDEKVYDSNTEMGSFIPTKVKIRMEKDILNETVLKPETVKIGNEAFNEFTTEYLATLAFPTLFPDGKGDPTKFSTRKMIAKSDTESFSEKIKHLIKFAEFIDGKWEYRFAAHPRFGFWAYNMLYRRRLLGQGSFYLKQNPGEANLTIEELQEMVRDGSYTSIMKKLLRYAKNITGTNAYWNNAKEQLKATINQVGAPTIFWTLSCAEFYWPEYHALFSNEKEDSSSLRNNIINNPHLIDWFFTVRVEIFVKHWLYESLGAEWHWYRFEYAVMRGSIHCHGVAKLRNDPGLCFLTKKALEGHLAEKKLSENATVDGALELEMKVDEGKAASQQVCDYVNSLVTACNPCTPEDGWVKPKVHPCKREINDIGIDDLAADYADLINCVQRHTKCSTAYCLRKKNDEEQYCRFNFPFEECDKTFIDFEEINSKKYGIQYRPKIILKRNDTRVNRHQRLQLQTWRANCDIQPIVDFNACLEYLAKYASKAEKISDVARDAFVSVVENLNGNEQMRSIIQKLMIKAVGERDFSVQEVMHHILSLKLISSSFQVVNVSVDGSRKIEFSNDDIVTEASIVDNYANRENLKGCDNTVLESNFVQFVSKYSVQKEIIKKRKREVIVRAFPSPPANPKGPQYGVSCKYQLLKYKPWRTRTSDAWDSLDEEDIDMFCQKWSEFLQSDLGQALVPNWRRELHNAELYFERTEIDDYEENIEGELEEWMYIADLHANNIDNVTTTDTTGNDADYWQSFRENYSEEQIGNMVSWLDKKRSETLSENCEATFDVNVDSLNEAQRKAFNIIFNHEMNPSEQLLMMIIGLAGSGKSYLINSIRALLKKKCVVSAYFGIAAFNIKGQTLHSLLKLPIRGRNLNDLKGPALLQLQERLTAVKYIIIDEYSVIGQNLLGWIDKRCRQGTGDSDKPFGGISIILVGDIAQLPPVGDKVLYHKKPSGEIGTMGFCMYRKFTTIVKLTVNERSKGNNTEQENFRVALYRLRDGNSTEEDWKMFLSRTPGSVNENVDRKRFVKLSFSNEKVASDNHEALMSLNVPVSQINARHSNKASVKLSSDDMGGLEPKLFLSISARVMLTRNLWTEKGLCNGSMGVVKDVIYHEGDSPPNLPLAVVVQFDSYSGPSIVIDQPGCVPIIPVTSVSDLHGSSHERQQLPLRLSWAITIHKSQGLTLDKAWIDLGTTEKFIGLAYVAVSRVRRLKDMIIEPMTLERLQDVKKRKDFEYREAEEQKINELAL